MGEYAVVDKNSVVVNIIDADADFIKTLPDQVADDKVDTGYFEASHKFYDVTKVNPKPGVGWTRSSNGKYSSPPEPEPTEAEVAARQHAEAARVVREADDTFLSSLRTKMDKKQALTQDERDRLLLINATRGGGVTL